MDTYARAVLLAQALVDVIEEIDSDDDLVSAGLLVSTRPELLRRLSKMTPEQKRQWAQNINRELEKGLWDSYKAARRRRKRNGLGKETR